PVNPTRRSRVPKRQSQQPPHFAAMHSSPSNAPSIMQESKRSHANFDVIVADCRAQRRPVLWSRPKPEASDSPYRGNTSFTASKYPSPLSASGSREDPYVHSLRALIVRILCPLLRESKKSFASTSACRNNAGVL